MPLFHLEYEAKLEYVVEAESQEALEAAAAKLNPEREFMDRPEWEVAAWLVKLEFMGKPVKTPEVHMGLLDGELLNIHDYRREIAKRPPVETPPPPDLRTLCLFCGVEACKTHGPKVSA